MLAGVWHHCTKQKSVLCRWLLIHLHQNHCPQTAAEYGIVNHSKAWRVKEVVAVIRCICVCVSGVLVRVMAYCGICCCVKSSCLMLCGSYSNWWQMSHLQWAELYAEKMQQYRISSIFVFTAVANNSKKCVGCAVVAVLKENCCCLLSVIIKVVFILKCCCI